MDKDDYTFTKEEMEALQRLANASDDLLEQDAFVIAEACQIDHEHLADPGKLTGILLSLADYSPNDRKQALKKFIQKVRAS